jgi:hypothetical protein
VDSNIEPSDCDKIHVTMNHATNGNDNFKFTYTINMHYSNGTSIDYEEPNKVTLTKENGSGSWDLSPTQQ